MPKRHPSKLTPIQRRILKLYAAGQRSTEIAGQVGINRRAVDYALQLMRAKCDGTTAGLIALAIEEGLIG